MELKSVSRLTKRRMVTKSYVCIVGFSLGLLGVLTTACEDKHKTLAPHATAALHRLIPLVKRDVEQVRTGLPTGAAELAKRVDKDPGADPAGLQRALRRARAAVRELDFSKSTFFMFVDPRGVVARSQIDPDRPAGRSLFAAVPAMKKLSEPNAALVEAFGKMKELRGVQNGPDMQWIVGYPVKNSEGKLQGSFVTGWSLRHYAKVLEDLTRSHLAKTLGDDTKAAPLAYVFVVKGAEAFSAPVTPDVNSEAVAKADLVAKTQGGPLRSLMEIDRRRFTLVAERCPALGDDVVLALLMTPL
jgi:hypothetical protein